MRVPPRRPDRGTTGFSWNDPEPTNWNVLENAYHPLVTDEDEWDAIWTAFSHELGNAISRGGGLTDQTRPKVADHEVVEAPGGGVTAVKWIFSENIDPATFTADDIWKGDMAAGIEAVTVTRLSGRVYEVSFPVQRFLHVTC